MNVHKRNSLFRGSLLALSLAIVSVPSMAEDSYLQGLKAESDKLESLGREARKEQEMLERNATAAPVPTAAKPAARESAKAPPPAANPLGMGEFEKGLKQYPAGFGLYEKLDAKAKQAVFAEYSKGETETRRYAAAIRKTIELSVPAQR